MAVKAGVVPPWLVTFLDSRHATQLLTGYERGQLRAAIGEGPEKLEKPKSIVELASAGGRGKRDKDEQRIKFFSTVQELWEQGLTGADIDKRLRQEHTSPPPQSTIYGWIGELKRPKIG
jgi:hypothetical protein